MKRLLKIQQTLKVGKGRKATGQKVSYSFRNSSDILEAVKPLLAEQGLCLLMGEDIKEIGGRFFLEATATIFDAETKEGIATTKSVAELGQHISMCNEQATGCAVSYARKYVLGGLFDIDDSTIDPDALDGDATRAFNYLCSNSAAAQYYEGAYGVDSFKKLNNNQLLEIYTQLVDNKKL